MKKRDEKLTRRKLVSHLVNDPLDGDVHALLATTYDFNPDFFETDFLPSLLGLKLASDRTWAGRIAMERKLALMESATILAQANRYNGRPRSLRVELLPVRLEGRRLHAKIVLVVFEKSVKMLVSSANLTERGYRHNREAAIAVTVSEKNPDAAPLVRSALEEMPRLFAPWWTEGAQRAAGAALARLSEWQTAASDDHNWFFWGGGSEPLWERFLTHWPQDERIDRITVVSPFWAENPDNEFLDLFLKTLLDRHALSPAAELSLLTEATPGTDGKHLPTLPAGYGKFNFESLGVTAVARAVDPAVLPEEVEFKQNFLGTRSLHAKVLVLEGPQSTLAYIGSANFTRRGWGFGIAPNRANIEAGLISLRRGAQRAQLRALIPATTGEPVKLNGAAAPALAIPEAYAAESGWPVFLRSVTLSPSAPGQLGLTLTLSSNRIAGAWSIDMLSQRTSGTEVTNLYRSDGSVNRQEEIQVPLDDSTLNQLLIDQEVAVTWWESAGAVAFPVNVDITAREALPIAPGAAKLQEQHMLAYYQGRIFWEDLFPDPDELGSLSRLDEITAAKSSVDTAAIQSYQIREFVEALAGIKDDLRQGCYSVPSMRLALFGPVSPTSLARTIVDSVRANNRTPMAAGFQLVEILACLDDAAEFDVPDKLANDWLNSLARAAKEIENILDTLKRERPDGLASKAFRRYESVARPRLAGARS